LLRNSLIVYHFGQKKKQGFKYTGQEAQAHYPATRPAPGRGRPRLPYRASSPGWYRAAETPLVI